VAQRIRETVEQLRAKKLAEQQAEQQGEDDQAIQLQSINQTSNTIIKDILSWISELIEENFLAIYDVILDIRQKLQLSNAVDIPLLIRQLKRVQSKQNFVGWALPIRSRV
jgi:hypothetical protein